MKIELKNYRITFLSIINEKPLTEEQKVKLTYKYKLCASTDSDCSVEGTATLDFSDEDTQSDKLFSVEISAKGFFTHENMEKDDLRIQGAKELLPFLRSHISTAMASIGLDPIIIPIYRIKEFNDN